jgi:hypothetical protein
LGGSSIYVGYLLQQSLIARAESFQLVEQSFGEGLHMASWFWTNQTAGIIGVGV